VITCLMVVVDEVKRADCYRLVERERNHPTEIVLIRLVDETISIVVVQIMGQDEDVADFGGTEVLIEVLVGTVGIEDYELVREVALTSCFHRNVHALSGKLIALDDRSRRKACQAYRAGLAMRVLGALHRPRAGAKHPSCCRRFVSYREQNRTDAEQ
jgi:hypothetical protein